MEITREKLVNLLANMTFKKAKFIELFRAIAYTKRFIDGTTAKCSIDDLIEKYGMDDVK